MSTVLELLDLIVRWVHVIAGIMWIGNSLLFNWLDRNLRPSSKGGEGMLGEIWLMHSGGFYFVEKTLLAGRQLPQPMHWFKWQAYTTWISGAVLLLVVYYVGGRALMVDPGIRDLSPAMGVAIGIGAIIVGELTYNGIWSTIGLRSARIAVALSLLAFVAIVIALTQLLSGRAAFLHVGAMLGTIMAANVGHVIMPSQRVLENAVRSGGRADPAIADRAKTRSIHNNYITFPVIALMLSSHWPALYAHRLSWLILLLLAAGGAGVRHVLNVRFGKPVRRWTMALAAVILGTIIPLYALVRFAGARTVSTGIAAQTADTPSFEQVRSIIDRRCAACHSRSPSDVSLGVTPAGVAFDTPEQIRALAPRIHERAVVTRTMPPANKTRITDEERAMLGRWFESGTGNAH